MFRTPDFELPQELIPLVTSWLRPALISLSLNIFKYLSNGRIVVSRLSQLSQVLFLWMRTRDAGLTVAQLSREFRDLMIA